jgi:predicted DNA repair protein MutK
MYIVAIAWIYVVLMMSITERSVIAGVMTFLLYGVLPLIVILYLMGTPQRKRKRLAAEISQRNADSQIETAEPREEEEKNDSATASR